MTLEEMENDPRNKPKTVICDPCQQERFEGTERLMTILGPTLYISHNCTMSVHNPINCQDPRSCMCKCHKDTGQMHRMARPDHLNLDRLPNSSGTELGAPNITALVRSTQKTERTGFSMAHRSDVCWSDSHLPSDCPSSWCDCWCHKGELPSDRVERSTKLAARNHAQRVGNVIGQKIWITDEEGQNRQVIMLPSGEIMEIQ